jgi:hypothetical protein
MMQASARIRLSLIATLIIVMPFMLPAIASAAADPWTAYCLNPTPENAAKVQSAKTPGIDNQEFDARLRILEDQVLCSDVEAIRLVYRLKKEPDGAYGETLSQMLGRLIRINPRLFLEELARHRPQVGDRLPWILCSIGPAYADRVAAKRYVLRSRLAAIETVDVPELGKLRDECGAELKRGIENLERHLEEPGTEKQDGLDPGDKPSGSVRAGEDAVAPVAGEAGSEPGILPRLESHFHRDRTRPARDRFPAGDWDLRVIEPWAIDRSKPASGLMRALEGPRVK